MCPQRLTIPPRLTSELAAELLWPLWIRFGEEIAHSGTDRELVSEAHRALWASSPVDEASLTVMTALIPDEDGPDITTGALLASNALAAIIYANRAANDLESEHWALTQVDEAADLADLRSEHRADQRPDETGYVITSDETSFTSMTAALLGDARASIARLDTARTVRETVVARSAQIWSTLAIRSP